MEQQFDRSFEKALRDYLRTEVSVQKGVNHAFVLCIRAYGEIDLERIRKKHTLLATAHTVQEGNLVNWQLRITAENEVQMQVLINEILPEDKRVLHVKQCEILRQRIQVKFGAAVDTKEPVDGVYFVRIRAFGQAELLRILSKLAEEE